MGAKDAVILKCFRCEKDLGVAWTFSVERLIPLLKEVEYWDCLEDAKNAPGEH